MTFPQAIHAEWSLSHTESAMNVAAIKSAPQVRHATGWRRRRGRANFAAEQPPVCGIRMRAGGGPQVFNFTGFL